MLRGEERSKFLASACGPDQELRAELDSLLEWSDKEENPLDTPGAGIAQVLAASLAEETPQRLGPYRIVGKIGDGGMGSVFLGERDDGVFEKRVAIKLIQPGLASEHFLRHFTRERRILARLEHPNITRLLDGGTAPDGRPFLVMEYVQGRSLTEHCRVKGLDITSRLRLFLQICSAVSYAHRNLVVHRDLKPGNILVTDAGVPKLLDFGLARLVDPLAEADLTRSIAWMTPDYASPEQVRGEPVTVASDVYSLGVILYEVLAERRPYQVDSTSPLSAAKAICETEPPPPSVATSLPQVRRDLKGDLDNITLRALEKEPGRRYESVEQFADDVQRYLDRRPVLARRAGTVYRMSKFVRRNRAAVAIGILATLAVLSGVGATEWQARRATKAFADVRQLAHSMLFEVHDAIQTLPGATSARELLVRRALEYLDGLARDASSDETLQRDLAEGYRRIADVQGEVGASSLGQASAARQSYQRAASFYRDLLTRRPKEVEYRRGLANCYEQLAMLAPQSRDGLLLARQAIATLEGAPDGRSGVSDLGTAYFNLARILTNMGDYKGALEQYGRARQQYQSAAAVNQRDNLKRNIALVEKRTGAILARLNRDAESAARYEAARALDEELVRAHPNDARAALDLSFDLSDLGLLAHKRGDHRASLALRRQAVSLRRAIADADPNDVRAQSSLASALSRAAGESRETGDFAAAEILGKKSVAIYAALDSRGVCDVSQFAASEATLADTYFAHGSAARACALWRSSRDRLAGMRSRGALAAADLADLASLNQQLAAHCQPRR